MIDQEELRKQLGLPAAPLVIKNIAVVSDFFVQQLGVSPLEWASYLRGIDFHKSVAKISLLPGRELVRHQPDNSRAKPFLYFADVGTSPMRTGTNFPIVTFERFRLNRTCLALQSTASSLSFSATDRVSRPGGAIQYIVAAADLRWMVRVTSG
jgi:hypothetical protein